MVKIILLDSITPLTKRQFFGILLSRFHPENGHFLFEHQGGQMATNHIAMITVLLDGEEQKLQLDLTGDAAQRLIKESRRCMAMIYLSFRNDDDVRHLVTAALGGFNKAQIKSLNGFVENLNISRRSKNKLDRKKIVYVWQLCELSAVTVLRNGIGRIGLTEIEAALEKIDLELDMKTKLKPILYLIDNRSFDSEELVRELKRQF